MSVDGLVPYITGKHLLLETQISETESDKEKIHSKTYLLGTVLNEANRPETFFGQFSMFEWIHSWFASRECRWLDIETWAAPPATNDSSTPLPLIKSTWRKFILLKWRNKFFNKISIIQYNISVHLKLITFMSTYYDIIYDIHTRIKSWLFYLQIFSKMIFSNSILVQCTLFSRC